MGLPASNPKKERVMVTAAMDKKTAEAVLKAEDARCRALMEKDLEALENLLSRDLVFVHSSGHRDDYDRHMEILRSPYLHYPNIVRKGMKVRLMGSVAIMTGQADITVQVEGQPANTVKAHVLQVWEHDHGRWRMSAYQATRAL